MKFNIQRLIALADHAEAWARAYVRLVEAMMKQGVPEGRARSDAVTALTFASFLPSEDGDDWKDLLP